MNQILETSLLTNKISKSPSKKTYFLLFQFIFSVIVIIIIFFYLLFNNVSLSKKENYSKKILANYNIAKLYSNQVTDQPLNSDSIVNIIGIIEIPKINLHYPILSNCTDEFLKLSPCKFYGPAPGEIGNLCIAGHNYDNNKFFSKLSFLSLNDEIIISDNYNNKYSYFIFDTYEVPSHDLSPIYSYNNSLKQLTLVTCNNINNNRIIFKAICKK